MRREIDAIIDNALERSWCGTFCFTLR
uniref:Uncharacterized protein n=1 Tax=Arundo donax TaxID=35708 RepID=A0A0A8Y7Z6_ARUDO